MFGRVMNLQARRQGPRGLGIERLVQAGGAVRVQVVHHQDYLDYLGHIGIHRQQQEANELGPIQACASVGDTHRALPRQRLDRHEHVHCATPLVRAVVLGHLTRLGRQRLTHLGDQLLAAFIQAHQRLLRIVGPMVDVQHVFHGSHELGRWLFRQAPTFLQPRLKFVFLSVRRTVSYDNDST